MDLQLQRMKIKLWNLQVTGWTGEKLYLSEAIQAQKAILCSLPYVGTTFEVLGLWDLILNIHGSQKTRKGLLGSQECF